VCAVLWVRALPPTGSSEPRLVSVVVGNREDLLSRVLAFELWVVLPHVLLRLFHQLVVRLGFDYLATGAVDCLHCRLLVVNAEAAAPIAAASRNGGMALSPYVDASGQQENHQHDDEYPSPDWHVDLPRPIPAADAAATERYPAASLLNHVSVTWPSIARTWNQGDVSRTARSSDRGYRSASGSGGSSGGRGVGGSGGSGSFHGSAGSGGSGVSMTGGSPGRVGWSGGSGRTLRDSDVSMYGWMTAAAAE